MSNSNIQDNKIDRIYLTIPDKPEYVSVVRLTASAVANRIGFNVEDIEDIKVAIAEACTCVLKNDMGVNNLDIEFSIYNDRLEMKVKNSSISSENQKSFEINSEKSKEKELGLFIIKSLMDEVEIIINNERQKEIKMIKNNRG